TISGAPLAFAGAEPLIFTSGANTVQTLNLNGASSGLFTLTLPLNTVAAPVTGATQVAPANVQTTVLLDIASLTAAGLKSALEALPAVGPGNVAVTLASGIFTI